LGKRLLIVMVDFVVVMMEPYCAWLAELWLYAVRRATACWMVVAEVMACPERVTAQ
jgi:hypothetical protein